ncbi:MAG: helix-turn-helix domain-containing protein [bacterium]
MSFSKITMEDSLNNISKKVDEAKKNSQRFRAEKARYTIILHAARKKLQITNNEYCLTDVIHKLSGNRSSVPGWCYASKECLAENIDVSRQSVHNMINKLVKKGLVELNSETGYLRTSDLWRESVEVVKSEVFGNNHN